MCQGTTTNGTIVDYEQFGDIIYATGFFNTVCDHSVGYVAKWENNEWEPSSINLTDPGHSFEVIGEQLFIAKYEESIDSNWVYVYDNASLETLGEGVYLTTASGFSQLPNIYDVIEYDESIIACGEFDRVGQEPVSGIMQWNGLNWESLGNGLSGNIINSAPVLFPHQMLVHNSELYVAGNFRYAGGVEVNGIAKWNGEEWTGLGEGFNGTVYSMSTFEGELIVGGSFTESAGQAIDRIARWDGVQWVGLDFGFTPLTVNDFIFVHTLKVINDALYIGGGLKEITYSDGTTEICNGIVSFDGEILNTFEGGVVGFDIEAITKTENQQLLIGGGVFGNGYAGILEVNSNILENSFESILIYPNPFDEFIRIVPMKISQNISFQIKQEG